MIPLKTKYLDLYHFYTVKREAECSPEMTMPTFQITKCHNPEDYNININPHWSLRLNIVRSNLVSRI